MLSKRLLSQPPDRSHQGHGDRCTPSHPDTLYAGVLAYSAPLGYPQQREGHHARTLYITAGLTIVILFIFGGEGGEYSYIFKFRTTFLACCTRMPHVTTSSFVCPLCTCTSLSVGVNNSLRKAAIGCLNVRSSCDLASVSTSSTI